MEENTVIQLKNVTFSYDTDLKETSGVHNINLTIKKGEVVVLCGESGCGKTTITRLINGLIPNYYEGNLTGTVLVNEKNVSNQPLYETANQIGSVFQNPRSQFFNVDTTSEITFGCENLGVPEDEIAVRLQQVTADLKLKNLLGRSIFQLSGGQKQKIACAGISIMHPDIFVLDEPSSNMDAQSIHELREILLYWKRQGKTIVISEHRLYYLRGVADRFLYMKDGKIKKEYDAEKFEQIEKREREDLGLRTFCLKNLCHTNITNFSKDTMELRNMHFAYKNSPETLHVQNCQIPANRIVAIIGNNGAGKSTFSRCFCGLEKHCGEVMWNNTVLRAKDRLKVCYMVMQDVNHQLFTESIQEEIAISMEQENDDEIMKIMKQLDLVKFQQRHPMSLSGGQKQRVAIASAIASKRKILFFDEPTSGLDYRHMKEVAEVLRKLQHIGESIFVITHDIELILNCCTDIIYMEQGNIKDQYSMDQRGIQKVKEYFIHTVV